MIITKEMLKEKVPKENMPVALDSAMNLYTFVKYQEKNGILVYNTNPDTWNCLYSFYETSHKFIYNDYTPSTPDPTYEQLMEDYQSLYSHI